MERTNDRSRGRRLSVSSVLVGGILGVLLTAGGPVIAQKAQTFIKGGGNAGKVTEKPFFYRENAGERRVVQIERDLFKIPAEYGEPFAVTQGTTTSTIWYRHDKWGVRNVVIQGDRRLAHVIARESQPPKNSEAPGSR